jgi:hypothetical protein
MTPHKFKVPSTKLGQVTTIKGYEGNSVRLQAILYSSENPSSHVYIYDKDNDLVAHPVPGQMEAKLMELPPIDCKLPLKILDETGGNSVTIYGIVYRPSLDS